MLRYNYNKGSHETCPNINLPVKLSDFKKTTTLTAAESVFFFLSHPCLLNVLVIVQPEGHASLQSWDLSWGHAVAIRPSRGASRSFQEENALLHTTAVHAECTDVACCTLILNACVVNTTKAAAKGFDCSNSMSAHTIYVKLGVAALIIISMGGGGRGRDWWRHSVRASTKGWVKSGLVMSNV